MTGTAYLFYQNILGALFLLPFLPCYMSKKKKELSEARKWRLNLEFRDGIQALSAALNAGYSIENAFSEALEDLKRIYDNSALIITEFEYMVHEIKLNQPVEQVIENFAQRSGIEDINNFSEVFITAKRTGGDLMKVIRTTEKVIGDKIEVKREIVTLITSKKFEARIMNMIPFGIILYMNVFSPGFLSPLYHNLLGIFIMTMALLIYFGAVILSEEIMNIEI